MLSPPHLAQGSWCSWLFGEPDDRGTLYARFGRQCSGGDLPAAFANALTELGEAACELLCGRFVVVALNRDQDRCVVARDQVGAQPLVYAPTVDGILFAEHERDLLELLPCTPGPDRLALLQWIDNSVTLEGHTFYEGLRRLQPGHQLGLAGRHAHIECWWALRYEGVEQGSESELALRLRDRTFAAIRRSTASSEHLGMKLSGGLDSACVAAGLTASGFADGHTLALGGVFPTHPATDESELIEATARHTGLSLELVPFDPASSILGPALTHIDRWRLPPATPNLFLSQPLMARARELGVDVMLDGEGGDELFGCSPHLIADMLRGGRLSTAWSLAGRLPGMGMHSGRRVRLRVLHDYGLNPLVPAPVRGYREALVRRIAASNSIVPRTDALELLDLQMASDQNQRSGPLWWRSLAKTLIDTRDLLDLGGHFRREARDERIERRHPLLYDLALIEEALRLPPQSLFDPVRDRPLLREALAGLIPEAVRTCHAKRYFTQLVLAGIQADEVGLIEPLRRTDAPVRAYVTPLALEQTIGKAAEERPTSAAGSLWRIAIANRWLASQPG
jgi:asparagine synthase (glutamine-hydrolysing)